MKRAFSGVIAAPPASVVRRKAPATIGMKARAISPSGISQSALLNDVARMRD